jgi:hypothetical protein
MNCASVLALYFVGLFAFGGGAAVAHELLTRWRYRQALRTLIEGETVIEWRKPSRK